MLAIGGAIDCYVQESYEARIVAGKKLPYSDGFSEIMRDIYTLDFDRIENASEGVSPEFLPEAVTAYFTLKTWDQKAALVHLVKESLDPVLKPIMLDFLNAPVYRYEEDIVDPIWWSIITVFCYLEGRMDKFDFYYDLDEEDFMEALQRFRQQFGATAP